MRHIETNLIAADLKRIWLALRHEEFGLTDPTRELRAQGFEVTENGQRTRLSVSFRDVVIADLEPQTRGNILRVCEAIPPEADAVLHALITHMAKTARQADARLKEDARRIESRQRTWFQGEKDHFPFPREGLFRLASASATWDQDIRFEMRVGEKADWFTLVLCADFPENEKHLNSAFWWGHETGEVTPYQMGVTPKQLRDLVALADPIYAAAAAGLPSTDTPHPGFWSPKFFEALDAEAFVFPARDLTVFGGRGVCQIARGATVVLRCERVDRQDPTHGSQVHIRHGGLAPGVVNALLHAIASTLSVPASEPESEMSVADLVREAGVRLRQVDFGYRF